MYKPTCTRFNSTYVGQTVQQLVTRVDEDRKENSPVGQHLLECNKELGDTAEIIDQTEIIDQPTGPPLWTANTEKLHILEILHSWRERLKINTRAEFRIRDLTLKL